MSKTLRQPLPKLVGFLSPEEMIDAGTFFVSGLRYSSYQYKTRLSSPPSPIFDPLYFLNRTFILLLHSSPFFPEKTGDMKWFPSFPFSLRPHAPCELVFFKPF